MISALLYDRLKKECGVIDAVFRDVVAKHTEEELKVKVCKSYDELESAVSHTEIVDLNLIEAVNEEGIGIAGKIREKYPDSAILLVVSSDMKPTQYIKPSIMASALIMRPVLRSDIRETLTEFVLSVVEEKNEATGEDAFFVETSGGRIRIPFDKLLYIEARQKRVYLRLKREEYGIKDSLETVLERLPDNFIRCHRSFIINRDKIKIYTAKDRIVSLEGDITIPVSRSFRHVMKEL